MKKVLLVILTAAVVLTAWIYNNGIVSIALLPVILLFQSILVSGNLAKTWSHVTPEMTRNKVGRATKVSIWSYIASTAILPYLWIAIFSMIGFFPLSTILVFLTLPVAIGCSRAMLKLPEGATSLLGDLCDRTINLSLMFSALLTLSFLIGKFI